MGRTVTSDTYPEPHPSYNARLSRLERYLANMIVPSAAWVAPTLLNSWVNTTVGPGTPAGYLKDPFGFVHLRGRLSGGASGTAAFDLPAGFLPAAFSLSDLYPLGVWNGGAAMSGGVVQIVAGSVNVYVPGGAFTEIGLGSITFLAEN